MDEYTTAMEQKKHSQTVLVETILGADKGSILLAFVGMNQVYNYYYAVTK